tara:strand:- start:1631 stop:2584 length:954 start_codon:yes stop_codon:yes gene_type:complete
MPEGITYHTAQNTGVEGKKGIIGVVVIFLILEGVAWGHFPEGQVYQAFHFPDQHTPVIDGNLGDWGGGVQSYAISTEAFTDLVSGADTEFDAADFSVSLMIGWNKSLNKLYIAAQVVDDIHQIDRPAGTAATQIFLDDDMEIFVDADHSGGQYANFADLSLEDQLRLNGTEANHFIIAAPPPDEDFFVNFSAAAWYALPDGPHSRAAYAIQSTLGGSTTMNYELMLTPYDRVDVGADFLSKEHVLVEDEILGFNVEFNDFDNFSQLFDAKFSLSGGQNAFQLSERFADLRLMAPEDVFQPTSVQYKSWGRIKASFAP